MDKFLEWIEKNKGHYAFNDRSYRKVLQNEQRSADTKNFKVNTELATYGDAVLSLSLCQILFGEKQLSVEKAKYESDEILVKVVAKHYSLLEYINFDREDKQIPKDYACKDKDDKYKFIATAVEACLGAIYMEKGMDTALEIVKTWKDIIDNSNKK